jgi:hypothetical protein
MARMAFNSTWLMKAAALVLACALLMLAFGEGARAYVGLRRALATAPPDGAQTVTLEQCVTSTVQAERSATFTAQMTATPATQRMGMRIELQQRMRGESEFHTVFAPGFGVWRPSEAGVKIYKYVKQVTNLAAPAAYRAVVRFRWLGDRGRVLKRAELRSTRCVEPTLTRQVTQTPVPQSSPTA